MFVLIQIFSTLVALEFFYIMYLETIATTSAKTSEVFGMEISELQRESVNTLFKNHGVYNALLSVLILLATWIFVSKIALICLMVYIILVAFYGAISSNPKILLMQGGLAIVTLILCLIF